LEGFVAALAAIVVTVFLLWTSLYALGIGNGFHPLSLLIGAMVAKFAMLVAIPILVLNLPFAALFALRFDGPLFAAIALGAACGALEGYLLAQIGERPSMGADLVISLLGAAGGAAFAWRVWLNTIPLRQAA
jgi:hypothetical protein